MTQHGDPPSLQEVPQVSRYLAKYQEVGEALGGVSLSTVRRLVDKGQLRKVKVGGQVFVPIESVEAFIARGGTAA